MYHNSPVPTANHPYQPQLTWINHKFTIHLNMYHNSHEPTLTHFEINHNSLDPTTTNLNPTSAIPHNLPHPLTPICRTIKPTRCITVLFQSPFGITQQSSVSQPQMQLPMTNFVGGAAQLMFQQVSCGTCTRWVVVGWGELWLVHVTVVEVGLG